MTRGGGAPCNPPLEVLLRESVPGPAWHLGSQGLYRGAEEREDEPSALPGASVLSVKDSDSVLAAPRNPPSCRLFSEGARKHGVCSKTDASALPTATQPEAYRTVQGVTGTPAECAESACPCPTPDTASVSPEAPGGQGGKGEENLSSPLQVILIVCIRFQILRLAWLRTGTGVVPSGDWRAEQKYQTSGSERYTSRLLGGQRGQRES